MKMYQTVGRISIKTVEDNKRDRIDYSLWKEFR